MKPTTADHQCALDQHERAYADMERMRDLHGYDSDEYQQARKDMLAANDEITAAYQRSLKPRTQPCPTCKGRGRVLA